VPINIKTGSNITPDLVPKYEWFSGPTVKQLLIEDQLRTNFDQVAFQKLCEEPFKMMLLDCFTVPGYGTVPEGLVISGKLNKGDFVRLYPHGRNADVRTLQSYLFNLDEAKPGDVAGINISTLHKREIELRFTYIVKADEGMTANSTLAFRASIVVMKSDRFTQHQVYNVFYGAARIRCILWWIFPEDGKNIADRKFKVERKIPSKPTRGDMDEETYRQKLKQYHLDVQKENEEYAKLLQARIGKVKRPPPKPKLKKATAILLPLIHYDIEPYKPSPFEKNYCGKVMMLETGVIIGVGRVDRVINFSSHYFIPPTNQDYKNQYGKVVSSASSLFKLPTEQKQLELFLDHVTNNEHAKNSIQQMKQLSFWKRWE
jgi:hypothetical protein